MSILNLKTGRVSALDAAPVMRGKFMVATVPGFGVVRFTPDASGAVNTRLMLALVN